MQPPEIRTRISFITGAFMLSVALGYDGFQIFQGLLFGVIPIVGWTAAWLMSVMIAIGSFMHFFIWNKLLDISMLEKMFVVIGLRLVEFLPLAGALPMITVSVFYTIMVVAWEDRKYNKKQQAEFQQAVARSRALPSSYKSNALDRRFRHQPRYENDPDLRDYQRRRGQKELEFA